MEVQTQMRKVDNVDTQRRKMLGSIFVYSGLALVQVIGECLRLDSVVIVAKALGECVAIRGARVVCVLCCGVSRAASVRCVR